MSGRKLVSGGLNETTDEVCPIREWAVVSDETKISAPENRGVWIAWSIRIGLLLTGLLKIDTGLALGVQL